MSTRHGIQVKIFVHYDESYIDAAVYTKIIARIGANKGKDARWPCLSLNEQEDHSEIRLVPQDSHHCQRTCLSH